MSESLRELYDRAIELTPAEREHFLAELEAGGAALAARLRRLLDAERSNLESPLDSGPWSQFEPESQTLPPEIPERIGPYRILSEIGRGGMGRVFLAEQEGEGFKRNVALKVVAPASAREKDLERRFGEERRILAGLEHPGIARFYDAGRAQDGSWYLALEYVAGSNLIHHARERQLSMIERVRLFLAVLEAVAFAHARSIVHRDLKPANILVGDDGRPRLLDFGIAKLLASTAGDRSSASTISATVTRTESRVLTPAYASPEQFRGETVSPASDVFSLGVLLYELLTDRHPFGDGRESQVELERAVLFEDPEPPSTAPKRRGDKASGPASGSHGRFPSLPTSGRIPRDLEAICLKALRKEPRDRYVSAAELAADVESFAAGLPVKARGGGLRYRLYRVYRRNRIALTTAAAIVATVIAVTAVFYARSAGRGAGGGAPRPDPAPRTFPYSGAAAADVSELERRFAAEPGSVETGAHLAIALDKGGRGSDAALIVARLRQIPGRTGDPLIDYVDATLATSGDEPQRALVLFGRALDGALAENRGDLVLQVRASRGRLLSTLGRGPEAHADMERARAGFEGSGDSASLARVLNDLSVEELQQGNLAAGERLLEQALVASRAAGAGGGGVILGNLAGLAVLRGRPDLAEPRYRESVRIFRELKSRRLSWALTDLSDALRDLGRRREADEALAEAIELLEATSSERDLAIALAFRGGAELDAGTLESVETTAAELEAAARTSGDRPALAFSNRLRGELAAERGNLPAARRLFGEARRQLFDNGQADWAAETDLIWARAELDFGELAAAARHANQALAPSLGGSKKLESTTAILAEIVLAEVDIGSRRGLEAHRRLDTLGETESSPSVRRTLALLTARARLFRSERRYDEARRDLTQALATAERAELEVAAGALRLELSEVGRLQGAELDQKELVPPSKPSANSDP